MCDDGFSWAESDGYCEVPIAPARAIAEVYDKDQVIIVCWDKKYGRSHVTTYGKLWIDSKQAAIGGNNIKKALGWPEFQCNDRSDRILALESAKRRLDTMFSAGAFENNELDRMMATALKNELIVALGN